MKTQKQGFPLSARQRALWQLAHETQCGFPNVVALAQVQGAFDEATFEKAALALVGNQESLRTVLEQFAGMREPLLVIEDPDQFQVVHWDLSERRAKDQEQAYKSVVEAIRRPAEGTRRGKFQLTVFKFSDRHFRICLSSSALLMDGESLALTAKALWLGYGEKDFQTVADTPRLQYMDVAEALDEKKSEAETHPDATYWQEEKFQQVMPQKLAPERVTTEKSPFRCEFHRLTFPWDPEDLETLTSRVGVGIEELSLACWQMLLWRWSGSPSVVSAVSHTGRTFKELSDIIGPLSHFLPLETAIDRKQSFSDYIRVLSSGLAKGRARDLSFSETVFKDQNMGEANPAYFPFAFEFIDWPGFESDRGTSFELDHLSSVCFRFKMKLSCQVGRETAQTVLSYDASLYLPETAMALHRQFNGLLKSLLDHRDQALGDLDLMTQTERNYLVREVHRGPSRSFDGMSTLSLIERHFRDTPEAIAIHGENRLWSYRCLERESRALARRLRAGGCGCDGVVGICLERSPEMVVAVLGVIWAGAAYVPLDPDLPLARLNTIVADAGISALVTKAGLGSTEIPADRVFNLDPFPDMSGEVDRELGATVWPSERAAYVLYTSGSTGKPKGAVVSHRGLDHHMRWMLQVFSFGTSDRVLMKTPFGFDASVWELYAPLMAGGTLVLAKPGGEKDGDYIRHLVSRAAVTVAQFVPTTLQLFLNGASSQKCRSLRHVFCGGEPLTPQLATQFFDSVQAQLHNVYGPTETTVQTTCWTCPPNPVPQTISIGRPITNSLVRVMDSHGRAVPIAVAGEICIGGPGLSRCYYGQPRRSAEKFVPDPHSSRPGQRLFKTGDLGCFEGDGNLRIFGRNDYQVKLRGFRIELPEIESVLRNHPTIEEARVLVRHFAGADQLVAFVTCHKGLEVAESDLRDHLRQQLPVYMVPSTITVLDVMPLTSSGKIDRLALGRKAEAFETSVKSRQQALDSGDPSDIEPATPTEAVLADIWASVLGLDHVNVNDNFFNLGGDSIRTIQIMSHAKERGIHYTLPQAFEHQTIRELVGHLDQAHTADQSGQVTEPLSLISAQDRDRLSDVIEDAYPLATLQTALYFLSQTSDVYEVYVTSFQVEAPLNIAVFKNTLGRVATRHPWLRTSFDFENFSQPLQLVHGQGQVPLTVEDLTHLDAEAQSSWLDHWIETEKKAKFAWDRVPFWRVAIHKRDRVSFQFTLIEPVFDGWSVATMVTEIFTTYFALLEGKTLGPPNQPPSTYRDFIALEQEALRDPQREAYWRQKLAGASGSKLPRLPGAGTANLLNATRRELITLPEKVSGDLEQLAAANDLPLKAVLFAVHARVVGFLCGETDVTTGMIVNGRSEAVGGDQVLGIFINTLPARMNLHGGSWLDLARQAFDVERDLLPHRRFPLATIQQRLGMKPVFEAAFNFTRFHVFKALKDLPQLEILDYIPWDQTFFPLTAQFHVNAFSGRVLLGLDYDAGQFSKAQMQRVSGYYQKALGFMAAAPGENFAGHDLLSPHERDALLTMWNGNRTGESGPADLCDAFEDWVRKTPDAVALSFQSQCLTYKKLNGWANRLGRHLQNLGASPETRIAIYSHRGPEIVAAMLAVLKIGASYMPLDPTYPSKRIAFMVSDSKASILLTQSRLVQSFPGDIARVVLLDGGNEPWQPFVDAHLPQPQIDPDLLAYTLYTSGSTGTPKGVQIPRRALANFLKTMSVEPGLDQNDRFLAVTTTSFDISGLELFLPLVNGSRLVLSSKDEAEQGEKLLSLLTRSKATAMQATPATWHLLLGAGWSGQAPFKILCGGDTLPRELANRLVAVCPLVWNLYGPTETTIWSSRHRVSLSDHPTPIGKPIGQTGIYILDRHMRPLPVGTPGELFIGGLGLSRGYWNRPALTAATFVPDPLWGAPGARMYRTGDLARTLEDGNFVHLGRMDHQIKLRGFRIELGEIETLLERHEHVDQCAVLVREVGGRPALVAYATPQWGRTLDSDDLKGHLRQDLPDYMCPETFVILAQMPLTPNHKIDRLRLPLPESKSHQREKLGRFLELLEDMPLEEAKSLISMEEKVLPS